MPSRRVLTSGWVPVVVTAVAVSSILLAYDVPGSALLRYAGYLAFAVALPGVFAWRLLLAALHTDEDGAPTWFEDLSLGTIFGFAIQLPVYLLGVWIGAPLLFLALPLVVLALTAATSPGRQVWKLPTGRLDVRAAWVLGAVIVYGAAWLGRNFLARWPVTLPPNRTPNIDESFHQALISELSHRFPPEIPFLLGTGLDYHWFVHAQMAATQWATGIESVLMLRAIMPTVAMALAVTGLGAVALRLTGRPVAAVIAPALLVAGGFHLNGPHYESWVFTELYLSVRFVFSPSQSYGVMMSMPAVMLLLEVLRPNRPAHRLTWLALAVSLFALAGAKATFMPVFLCGAIAVWGVHLLLHRRIDRTASALVGLLVVVTLFAQLVLFGGQTGGMSVDPFNTVKASLRTQDIVVSQRSMWAMTATMLIGWLLYGVGAVALARRNRWRDPRAVWLLVAIPAGITVAFVFYRSGMSQLWFPRTVAGLVVLASAWGMAYVLPKPLTRFHALLFAGAAGTAGLLAFVASNLVENRKPDEVHATYDSIVLTALTPVVIVGVYVAVRLVFAMLRTGPRQGPAILLSFLLGLGLVNVGALAWDTVVRGSVTPAGPQRLFAKGGVAAAEYIADHSSPDDVVATNVHCAKPDDRRCDNRSFWVSAYTQRRVVIEGWGYTAPTNANYEPGTRNAYIPVPFPDRLATNDAVFDDPSADTLERLVDSYGVDWLFVSKKYPADLKGLNSLKDRLSREFRNENYVVFKVDSESQSLVHQ